MSEVFYIEINGFVKINRIKIDTTKEPKSFDVANHFMELVIYSLDQGYELIVDVDGVVF